MSGRITTIHLITHCRCIVHEFGWSVYWMAWKVSFQGGTFLEAIRRVQECQNH
jgi:hypothetical protein